jgi:hypothetical protein
LPKFQKRHYEAIAEVISAMRLDAQESQDLIASVAAGALTERSVKLFAEDNPKFKPGVFRRACEPTR